MKLGSSVVSATCVIAFCHCGPLVNDPPLDGGSGTTTGNSGAGSTTGSLSGSVAEASASGSTSGASGSTAGAAGASGASSGAATGDDTEASTSTTDSAASGSSSGASGTSGASGGPDATTPGNNLVLNGDFSQGGTYWGISSGTGDIDAGTNQLCVSVGSNSGTVYLGWPQPSTMTGMNLAMGTAYTFSYKAQSTQGNLTIEAKIADSMSPYTPTDSDSTMEMVTGSLQTFTHTFTPTSPDTSAGLVFIFSSSSVNTICFESVSVVAQ